MRRHRYRIWHRNGRAWTTDAHYTRREVVRLVGHLLGGEGGESVEMIEELR